ncbi:MAG: tyrosine-type recombinase/integrase [Negativicutes bacterium]|nr:tyrosine-type recombinase/integrase [Negativicutes bacterium]
MKPGLNSPFADDITSFFAFRESFGFGMYGARLYLRKFDAYCAERHPSARALTRELVLEWMNDAAAQGHVGMAGRGGAIRIFGKYLRAMGKEAYVLPSEFFASKSTFTPYILSPSELKAFFDATDRIDKWHCGDRFAPTVAPVLFRLLYTCGLRPTEIRALRNNDVDLETGVVHIHVNKQKKERLVVLSDDMCRLLNSYWVQRNKIFVRTEFFFPRADGEQYSNQRLGALCDRCWMLANPGIPRSKLPPLRPYDFRHSFASAILQKWLDEGKDLYNMLPYLRSYMGHEHIEDTAYYIHILPERLLHSPGVDWERLDATLPGVEIWD